MFWIIEGFFLLGSFSIGYSLARIGFPSIQNANVGKKLGLGYVLGLIVLGVPALLGVLIQVPEQAFFLLGFLAYAILLIILFVKRASKKEKDPIVLKKEKPKLVIPKMVSSKSTAVELDPKKIFFEHGLMVGGKRATLPGEIKKQVFKEKADNNMVLKAIERKTKEMEAKNQESEKNVALDRLRAYAQQIKEKKLEKKKTELEEAEQMDEIEEDLLNGIGKEKEE
jgi:hypothetical protein